MLCLCLHKPYEYIIVHDKISLVCLLKQRIWQRFRFIVSFVTIEIVVFDVIKLYHTYNLTIMIRKFGEKSIDNSDATLYQQYQVT